MNAIIFDIDNTLNINTLARKEMLQGKNKEGWSWDKFHQLGIFCPVNKRTKDILLNHYKRNKKIILITARPDKWYLDTVRWLENNQIPYHDLYMRKDTDFRKSVEVKEDILFELLEYFDFELAYDDQEDVCQMYESHNIKSILVKPIKDAGSYLLDSASIYIQKTFEYGDSYKEFGKILLSLFPNGIELKKEIDFTRFSILIWALSKVDRYCKNFSNGGHTDSLTDLSVYPAMLKEIDDVNNSI